MKFLVSRTSDWFDIDAPCDEAIRTKITTPKGDVEKYVVEINSIEELTVFVNKYGNIVLSPLPSDSYYQPLMEIEIYDTYRE